MTGYSITPESSISNNWMDFVLIYALSFSIAYRLNLCMGFHPLLSPAIIHFTLIIMIGIPWSAAAWSTEESAKKICSIWMSFTLVWSCDQNRGHTRQALCWVVRVRGQKQQMCFIYDLILLLLLCFNFNSFISIQTYMKVLIWQRQTKEKKAMKELSLAHICIHLQRAACINEYKSILPTHSSTDFCLNGRMCVWESSHSINSVLLVLSGFRNMQRWIGDYASINMNVNDPQSVSAGQWAALTPACQRCLPPRMICETTLNQSLALN